MKDISSQFTFAKQNISSDYLSVNKETFLPIENKLFYLFNELDNRNIISERPVMVQVCYNGEDSWYYNNTCFMAPKVRQVTDNEGNIIGNEIEMESYISNNTWINELENIIAKDEIIEKLNTLESISKNLFEKIYKFGNDYIARADIIDKYTCNCINTMNAIGNIYLHLGYDKFLEPTYTKSYTIYQDDGSSNIVSETLLKNGLILRSTPFIFEHGLLYMYDLYITNFTNLLYQYINDIKNNYNEEDRQQFYDNFLIYNDIQYENDPKFSYIEFKLKCQKFKNDILTWLDERINLIQNGLDIIDNFDNILKIISTVAITINVSKKANNLQQNISKGYDSEAVIYNEEIYIAQTVAMDYKFYYPQQQLGEAMQLAIKKAINYFGYYNKFEDFITNTYLQGIPQYDKIES
jgi:hypothetical protein